MHARSHDLCAPRLYHLLYVLYVVPLVSLWFTPNVKARGLNYEGREGFVDTVKRAKARVEVRLEERLDGSNATGTIFNLKNNFGWKDVQEQKIDANVVNKIEYEIVGPSDTGS